MIIQILMSYALLFLVPAVVGTLFEKVHNGPKKPLFYWISGQMLLWAGFQLISVPLILKQCKFSQVQNVYNIFVLILLIFAIASLVCRLRGTLKLEKEEIQKAARDRNSIFLWMVFSVLLLLQLVLSVCLAYEEGDDAFYVAISTSTEQSDLMYQSLPYTGLTTGLDARHGLAPFPIWIVYLARMAGMPAVTMAQVVLPLFVILMTYGIYYFLAEHLLSEKRKWIPLFMIIVELMYLFGGYSDYSAENFLLVRATQGKAVMANVIIPTLIYLLFRLMAYIERKQKPRIMYWLLLVFTMVAGCLCSTLGTLLTCMIVGVVGICIVFIYKEWKVLIPMVISCVIPVVFALLYFLLRW